MDKNKSKITNSIVSVLILAGMLVTVKTSLAQSPSRAMQRELKREVVINNKEAVQERTRNIIEQVKDAIKEKMKRQIKGKLVTIVDTILTVQNDKETYTITTTDKTQLKRRFGATSTLSEFKPNDQLLIIGNRKKNTDGTLSSTDIEASYIRNMSIQRRFAVFNGEVKSIENNIITLQTKSRGLQTVNVSDSTEYKERNIAISLEKLSEGDNLIVKGELWDRVNNVIDAKTIIRLVKKNPTTTPLESGKQQD